MKKILGALLTIALISLIFSGCGVFPEKKVTLYSPDGETKTVSRREAEKYDGSKKWYDEPVQTLYSEDGEKVFKKTGGSKRLLPECTPKTGKASSLKKATLKNTKTPAGTAESLLLFTMRTAT